MSRRTGKTTRIIDRCIQELFTKGFTFLYESRDCSDKDNLDLRHSFDMRMKLEHIDSFKKMSGKYDIIDGIKCFKIWI